MSPKDTLTNEQQIEAFVERFLTSTAGAFNIFSIYLGHRLGFYHALADGAAATPADLAQRTGTHERYVREWLEQQTVADILQVEDEAVPATARRYYLPPAQAEVLAARDSLNYLAPLAQLLMGAVRPIAQVLEAYRNGGGVPYHEYGPDLREGQAGINRVMFLKQLGTQWLPALADVHERLQADPPARVADIGCGYGWSSIGMAQAYPKISVDGFDLDQASIVKARANAAEAGLEGRVAFHQRDAGDASLAGRYDLVTAFECIHDMSDPIGVLSTMLKLAEAKGAVLVMDERVGNTFTAKGNDVEWMMYGWSILHCLPVGLADNPSAATGTVMRSDTLRRYAELAGFCDLEILPIDNFFFRFYRLKPVCDV